MRRNGQSLIELLAVLGILATLTLIAATNVINALRRTALHTATGELEGSMAVARNEAETLQRNCGLKFEKGGDVWLYSVYVDGDGDGVRNDDIRSGVDYRLLGPTPLLQTGGIARIGLPSKPVRDLDSGELLDPDSSPVRFNSSTICSFSPDSTATPGSVYLTDGSDDVALMVRVTPLTGNFRVMRYDRGLGTWTAW